MAGLVGQRTKPSKTLLGADLLLPPIHTVGGGGGGAEAGEDSVLLRVAAAPRVHERPGQRSGDGSYAFPTYGLQPGQAAGHAAAMSPHSLQWADDQADSGRRGMAPDVYMQALRRQVGEGEAGSSSENSSAGSSPLRALRPSQSGLTVVALGDMTYSQWVAVNRDASPKVLDAARQVRGAREGSMPR